MRKLIPLFAIAFVALALLPFAADAQAQERLIPCGGFELDAKGNYIDRQTLKTPLPPGLGKINDSEMAKLQPPCGLCHGFKLIDNIIDFFLWPVPFNNGAAPVPIVAAVLIVIGGFYLMVAGGNPNQLAKAKSILSAVVIGILIIYGSYLLINTFFMAIGVNEWVGFKDGAWTVMCEGEPIFPAPPLTQ